MARTLYDILGVAAGAGTDEIRAAYTKLAERVPPLDATQRLAAREAFGTLVHPQRRAAYDASLHATPRHAAVDDTPALRKPVVMTLALVLAAGAWWASRPARPKAAAPVPHIESMSPRQDPAAATMAAPAAPARVLSAEELFALASPSVVRVNALGASGESLAFGSGVVVDAATVVTNCHVARRGAGLSVKHASGQFEASVATADEAHDLCRLSVPGLSAPSVRVGSVSQLRVGQKVFAIGSPQGLDLTLSDGMVSSLREGPEGALVQTTAPISPGSSGGGLFDETGALVGIVTFQVRSGQNLNFALPADWIATLAPSSGSREALTAALPGTSAPPPPAGHAEGSPIVGRWTCFGPLTGRGVELQLRADGQVGGVFDGKPLRGRWALQNGRLFLVDGSFAVEELDGSRMVLSQGQGRRLACSR